MLVITPDLRDKIAELCREYHVAELSLFGSGAREDFDPARSDVDLLVEFLPTAEIGLIGFSQMQARLEELFRRKVDLGTKSSLRPSIRDEVLAEAVPVYWYGPHTAAR